MKRNDKKIALCEKCLADAIHKFESKSTYKKGLPV